MPALICGSLAFDTITNFHGRFAQQILPEQVHILNVSFLVPTLRREYGGCAGNIAYTHKALGAEPIVMATLGSDGEDYRKRLESQGLDLSCVRRIDHNYTAQAIIITDESNNQITAFHPGAMAEAHLNAAKCFESGKSEKQCHEQLAKDCKGLAIGKYCGMKHRH